MAAGPNIGRNFSAGVRCTSRAGWTLIEILVVVTILAIAAGIVIPNVVNTKDMQAVSAARIIASDLQFAQNTAITTQATVAVVFTPEGATYKLATDDNQSTPLNNPMTRADYIVTFTESTGFGSLRIVRTTFPLNKVRFDALGAPDNAGTITVQAGESVFDISLAASTGKVTVKSTGL